MPGSKNHKGAKVMNDQRIQGVETELQGGSSSRGLSKIRSRTT